MKKIWLIFLFFGYQILFGQQPYYANFSLKEGFPTSTVYSVNEDKMGYLWFTTDVGIVKYDSHKFELFNTDRGISDNEVFQMKTDSKGRSWFLTLTGKLSFIYRNKIYNESNSSLAKLASGTSITTDFYEDEAKNIYFVYRNGEITIINNKNQVFKRNTKHLSLSGIFKHKKDLFFLESGGIYNTTSKKFTLPFSKLNYNKIFHTKYGDYIGIDNTLYKVVRNGTLQKTISLPIENEILNIFIERENNQWICARNGLYSVKNNNIDKIYFNDYTITSITKDFEGGYWISTLKNGVLYVPSFSFLIENFNTNEAPKLNCIAINPKKELWIGGDRNDYYIKKADQPLVKKELRPETRKDKISHIRFFNNNTYVIGKLGIKKIDVLGHEKILSFSANDLFINKNKTYIGYTYTNKIPTSDIEILKTGYLKENIFLDKRTNVFCESIDDSFWIGTNNGLYNSSSEGVITNWGEKNTSLENSIEDIYFDKTSGFSFIATASKGITIIAKNKIKYVVTKTDGLNSNTCNTIKKIATNHYLIGTNYGLNSLVLKNNNSVEVKNLNAVLGIQNIKIRDLNFLENKVYLATENGLLYFDISQIRNDQKKPICHIISLKNNGQFVSNNSKINYQHRDVTVQFNGISYINKGALAYFYKLNNETWTSAQETQINFKSLAAGKYTFKVYCVDVNGIKSDVQEVRFEILAPFWQKWWFISVCSLGVIISIYSFIKYRLKIQQNRFEAEKSKIQLEKQLIELEQKALRMQMNPHFIFNALNTIKGYYTEGNLVEASTYISKFSKLLRKLLESEEQITTLDNEIEMLRLYIELTQIRYEGKFDFTISISKDIPTSDTLIPNLLVQPLVENAIIHGLGPKPEKGHLDISFFTENQFLFCIVDDNGIGREAALKNQTNKEHQSKAMDIINERLQLFSPLSTLEILDKKNKNNESLGTKAIIKIPLKHQW